MRAIGLGHRTRVLIGCHLIMMESGSITVTGTEIADGLNMTTTGTTTDTVILTVTMTMTETMTGTAITARSALTADPPSSAHRSVLCMAGFGDLSRLM